MVKEIDFVELRALLVQGADLIDVREPEETSEDSKLPGDRNWPLSTFGLRQKDLSKDRPTIFYCRSGLRSLKAAEIAEAWTDQTLYFLKGGLLNVKS